VACITVTVWPPELLLRASPVRAEDELRRGVAADLSPPAQQNLCDYLTSAITYMRCRSRAISKRVPIALRSQFGEPQVARLDLAQVSAVCDAAMREFGVPERIRTDNGAPFAGVGLLGLSKLSLGWMKLGIVHERIQPGHPQQNPYVAYCTSLEHCGKIRFEVARSWSLIPCCFRGGLSSSS
jgi:hypothetical protein